MNVYASILEIDIKISTLLYVSDIASFDIIKMEHKP